MENSKYDTVACFLGAHLEGADSRRFRNVSFDFSHLFDWVGISGINEEFDDAGQVTITYRDPESINATFKALDAEARVGLLIWFRE